ncbi:hypothetical protein F2Q70_00022059 [Brassica cretica]|uniref:Uncharacterized protein n=1 Tax=Brassica cretica TaxID=69181 RepID=A0A8S9GTU7_BRACR|nr:hypothetical protein F2Q70_00022059 [Brassica cretica]
MFYIAHRSASTSECNADSHRVKFRVPISCMSSLLSIQTHPHPLKRSEAVQDPSSKQILPKLKTWFTSLLLSRTCGGIISFAFITGAIGLAGLAGVVGIHGSSHTLTS